MTRDDGEDDREAVTRVELGVMLLSALLTVALFGLVVGAALTTPQAAAPTATVDRVETAENGTVHATVRFLNRGNTGIERSQVEVTCGDESRQVTFANVPASDERRATVVCPAGSDPTAELLWWVDP
ncbi:hypothetical protein [Halogeometricum limi]|uniref:Uncharacterized protein n=1 Tax=Halogeometricum limi TaxID=555875 RepID=A0A1I6G3E6_9EURY|nr:hypothetical protein [Halogeometricum limi]SFR36733.1 hypothetical protein SAMN04488124_0811 [Halogeometricum limi]